MLLRMGTHYPLPTNFIPSPKPSNNTYNNFHPSNQLLSKISPQIFRSLRSHLHRSLPHSLNQHPVCAEIP